MSNPSGISKSSKPEKFNAAEVGQDEPPPDADLSLALERYADQNGPLTTIAFAIFRMKRRGFYFTSFEDTAALRARQHLSTQPSSQQEPG